MTQPDATTFAGLIAVTATATVVHPDGADLTQLPDPTPVVGDDEQENH